MAKEIISVTSFNNASGTVVVPSGLTNSMLVVRIGTHQGTISTVTWNSQALTKIREDATAFNECSDLWVLLNPTAASGTLSVSMSGGSWYGGDAIVLNNVKQTTSVTNTGTNGSSSSASTVIVPPVGNVFIIASMGAEANATSSSPTQGVRTTLQGTSFENFAGLFYGNGTGVPQTITFGLSSGQRWAISVMCIEDVSTGSEVTLSRHLEVGDGMSRSEFLT